MSKIKFELIKESWNETHPAVCEGYDTKQAVEEYCAKHFSDWDYPDEITIYVRAAGSNDAWEKYNIEVVPVPEFQLSDPEMVSDEEARGRS